MVYIYIYNEILVIKKRKNAICSNLAGQRGYHTKWSKSYKERQISCDITYTWNV